MTSEGSSNPGPRTKVHRLITEHDLADLGEELERQWTAEESSERTSLRDLARTVNTRLLDAVLQDAGGNPLEGEVENLYRLLTDDDVSAADRTRAERRLQRHGVDVESLRSDFVSYQAVRTYLTEHRDAEYPSDDDGDRSETVAEQIEQLRNRLVTVTDSKLDQLRSTDALSLGDHEITVNIQVYCPDCDGQYEVATLLERGGCDCEP